MELRLITQQRDGREDVGAGPPAEPASWCTMYRPPRRLSWSVRRIRPTTQREFNLSPFSIRHGLLVDYSGRANGGLGVSIMPPRGNARTGNQWAHVWLVPKMHTSGGLPEFGSRRSTASHEPGALACPRTLRRRGTRSDHEAFGRGASSSSAKRAQRFWCVLKRPAVAKYAVIPVLPGTVAARRGGSPTTATHPLIIARTPPHVNPRPVSRRPEGVDAPEESLWALRVPAPRCTRRGPPPTGSEPARHGAWCPSRGA